MLIYYLLKSLTIMTSFLPGPKVFGLEFLVHDERLSRMITYEQLLSENIIPKNSPLYLIDETDKWDMLFFDIETTGFKPEFSQLYLIGAVFYTNDGWKAMQWMTERPAEELVLLRVFAEFIRPYKEILHFNGDRFDIPYMTQKYEMAGLPNPFTGKISRDIYKDIKPYKCFLNLSNMNQKALERFIGLYREDQYDGGELIEKYKQFVRGKAKDENLKKMLLLHNLEDIIGMLKLTCLYSYPAFAKIINDFPEVQIDVKLQPTAIELTYSAPFSFPAAVEKMHPDYDSCCLTLAESNARLSLPIFTGELKFFFDNPRDYYYLPVEDMAIHKSVASFVEKEYRKKATKETCYNRRTGMFLPHNGSEQIPVFKTCCKSKDIWMEYRPDAPTADQVLQLSRLFQNITLSILSLKK